VFASYVEFRKMNEVHRLINSDCSYKMSEFELIVWDRVQKLALLITVMNKQVS
jgi:hypothetical protein